MLCSALPFNIPYPVPFKLLGDETKGWIDITYLNPEGTFRLTRGNKGSHNKALSGLLMCALLQHANQDHTKTRTCH